MGEVYRERTGSGREGAAWGRCIGCAHGLEGDAQFVCSASVEHTLERNTQFVGSVSVEQTTGTH